jgi:hypothetical protein
MSDLISRALSVKPSENFSEEAVALRAEIAHLTCEQIARGGLRVVPKPGDWFKPQRVRDESNEDYEKRVALSRIAHVDAIMRAESVNGANLLTCKRAAFDLDAAGQHGEAAAIREHIRQQWGRFAAQEAA